MPISISLSVTYVGAHFFWRRQSIGRATLLQIQPTNAVILFSRQVNFTFNLNFISPTWPPICFSTAYEELPNFMTRTGGERQAAHAHSLQFISLLWQLLSFADRLSFRLKRFTQPEEEFNGEERFCFSLSTKAVGVFLFLFLPHELRH